MHGYFKTLGSSWIETAYDNFSSIPTKENVVETLKLKLKGYWKVEL